MAGDSRAKEKEGRNVKSVAAGEIRSDKIPSGNTQPQSSQLAEPLWTDPGLKSGTSVRELIPT